MPLACQNMPLSEGVHSDLWTLRRRAGWTCFAGLSRERVAIAGEKVKKRAARWPGGPGGGLLATDLSKEKIGWEHRRV